MITPEQIADWANNPVTVELVQLVAKVIEDVQVAKAQTFTPGDPAKTHETLAVLMGAEGAWDTILEALRGDWDFMIEEESDE